MQPGEFFFMRRVLAVLCFAFIAATSSAHAQLTTMSPTGAWALTSAGTPLAAKIVLEQQGETLSGTFGNGGTLSGTISADNFLKYDVHFSDARGRGWATIIFNEGYTSFHGEWGFTSGKRRGTFTAIRYVPPLPVVPIAGVWDITVSGPVSQSGRVIVKKKGDTYTGTWPSGHAAGAFTTQPYVMRGTWQVAEKAGTFTITFSPDGTTFTGTWGIGDQPAVGQVAGRRN